MHKRGVAMWKSSVLDPWKGMEWSGWNNTYKIWLGEIWFTNVSLYTVPLKYLRTV